jgi:hypothetical protein
MRRLTDEQIDFIVDQVNESQIESGELKEDLIDHFCCIIEDNMRQGKTFEDSYKKAYQSICPNGLNEIYQESFFLLSSKRIKTMKKLLLASGFIVIFILLTGIVFKIQHWPAGGLLLLIAAATLIFVFLPLVFIYFYKSEYSKYLSYKMKYILGYLGLALLFTGAILKLFHLPGSGWTLLISLFVLNFGFLPILFYRSYKGSEIKTKSSNSFSGKLYILGLSGIALLLTGAVLKVLHLPGAAVLLGVALIVLNFGFLPVLFYSLYKKTAN